MRLVIMGPPGAGKGTHAKTIADKFSIPWVSTGEIFRHHKAQQTEFGKLVESYIDRGEFVPDAVTDRIVRERLHEADAKDGWLLDGYPRSVPQAEVLEAGLKQEGHQLDAVIYLDVTAQEVMSRLLHRAEVEGRADDTAEVIGHRLDVFFTSTEPLLDFYSQRQLLCKVDGLGSISEIRNRLHKTLDELAQGSSLE